MSDKNLEEQLENIENLKSKEFRVLGIKVSFLSVSALLALIGSVLGALYGGFLMYQKVEEVAGLDISAFEQRMDIIETKLDEAIDYTRDIKSNLRDDIMKIEKQGDRNEDIVKDTEDKLNDRMRQLEKDIFDMIEIAEGRFETKRDAIQEDYDKKSTSLLIDYEARADKLNDNYDEKAERLNKNINDDLEKLDADIKQLMKELEERVNNRVQKSLDNPLAN